MAPEQASGQEAVDARADVFALGCLAFECVTGQRAFQAHQKPALAPGICLPRGHGGVANLHTPPFRDVRAASNG